MLLSRSLLRRHSVLPGFDLALGFTLFYLGFVSTTADAGLKAAVTEINTGRAALYAQTAAKTGVTAEAAGQATARQLYDRIPAGQWYKPLGGSWTRK